ncbi:unnamed protein product [Rotaria sp. Silwood1]|nr:unnamed protein product [Rotaria sp. Silwood1]CAF1681654.1 unnamed protein product [Rotaria sp. Silwood1]
MDKKKSTSTASGSSSPSTINKPKKSSSTTAAASLPTTTTSRNAVLPQTARRILQNFLLVWLDANLQESDNDFKNSLQHLRKIVASITTFTDAQQCVNFLSEIKKEKVFMIVSGSLGRQIVPEIEALPQLEAIYVFCGNQSVHEQWAKKISKVNGVYTNIQPICQALEIDRQRCDQAMIPISFNGRDALFMYTQLLKEALLEIEDDDVKSIKDLVEYCRLQDDIDEGQIRKVENEYRDHTPIWWYTAETFIYPMLNRGLRQMDVDIILKMGFFIRHLHQHITELHREQQGNMPTNFQVFRRQGLSMEDFEKMKKTKGGLMSFNNFLSTSRNREISFKNFARPAALNTNSVGILFVMNIDTAICTKSSTPFAAVSKVGYYKDKEEEILFSTHAIFRIDRIERIEDKHTDRLWQVNLTIVGNQDDDFNTLTAHLREESTWATGWARFGHILIKLEKLLQIMERDIKVIICRQCHYTSYKQSILCKQKQHYIKICEIKQKFFECIECHKRIFTWSQYPIENCMNCHSLKGFRRTSLIRERHGTKFEDEILLLRGEEEKFLNSFISYKKLPNIID